MEVAREKLVAPTLFDVVAPRSSPEPASGVSFRDCLTSISTPNIATSSSTTSRSSADNPKPRDTKPSTVEQSRPSEGRERAQDEVSKSKDDAASEETAANASGEEQAEATDVSEAKAQDAPISEDAESSDEEPTVAAELLAAASAVVPPNQPLPDDAAAEEKSAQGKLAMEGVEAVPQSQEKTELAEAVDTVEASAKPSEANAAERLAMPAVEPGKETKQAVKPEVAEAAEESHESVEQTEPEATNDSALEEFPMTMPGEVQPADQKSSDEQSDHDRRQSNDNAKKVVATESEAVSAQQPSSEPIPRTDAPGIEKAKAETEPSSEEVSVEPIEARGNEPTTSTPATVATTEFVTPSTAAANPDATVTASSQNDSSSPTTATPTVDANANAASSAQATTPRVPPALLRNAESHGPTQVRPGEIDPARFLSRVVKAFESAQQRDMEVRLRLHPSELGSLSIEVKVQDSALTARLQAETPEARTALLDNLPMLRERLAEQGIRIEKFDVDLMDHSDRQPQQSPSEQMPEDSGRRASQTRTPTTTTKTIEKEIKATNGRGGGATDRLNVVI